MASLAVIILLTALTGVTPLSIDMPLPALPALAARLAIKLGARSLQARM